MTTIEDKASAIRDIAHAAGIHVDNLERDLRNESRYTFANNPDTTRARQGYINKVRDSLRVVRGISFDETGTVQERVRDLELGQAVDLLHAVEDHIRQLRRNSRTPLA